MFSLNRIKEEFGSLKLLLVDDEKAAREPINQFLSLFFNKVYQAKDGMEALQVYKENPVDIIITDLLMPKMCGFDLINAVRDIRPKQKIIIMSAQTDKDTIVKAITYRVDGYILKPINQTQMFESIEKTVASFLIERENVEYQQRLEAKVKEQVTKIETYSRQMIRQLEQDSLTGLPNKEKLQIDCAQSLPHWMVLINIDNLKYINIAYGMQEGDILLRQVADFLSEIAHNHVYRVNGDEFIITSMHEDKHLIEALAKEIHQKVYSKRFELTQASVRITFTMGIVPVNESENVPYHKAHLAVRQLRTKRKNSMGFYSEDLQLRRYHETMNEWAYKTKLALELDLLVPYFQPIVNAKTNEIEKYECLARIIDRDEVITPAAFVEASRISGMIVDVTQRIIYKAFKIFSQSDKEFSINITDDDLKEEYLIGFLSKLTRKYGISPGQVVLEVLENISEYDASHALEQLEALKSLGYQIAIDDFGAESSNFARLQHLNINYIKIDGSFIKDINSDANSLNIVKTIIFYAKQSGLKTIAEYVHNKDVYETLLQLGVDYLQGYYLYKPLKDVV